MTNITGNVFLPQTPEIFKYDADGNLTNDGRWAYTWDAENRLVNMTANANVPSASKVLKLDFTYDHRARRITKKVSTWNGSSYVAASTNKFLYDGCSAVGRSFQRGRDRKGVGATVRADARGIDFAKLH